MNKSSCVALSYSWAPGACFPLPAPSTPTLQPCCPGCPCHVPSNSCVSSMHLQGMLQTSRPRPASIASNRECACKHMYRTPTHRLWSSWNVVLCLHVSQNSLTDRFSGGGGCTCRRVPSWSSTFEKQLHRDVPAQHGQHGQHGSHSHTVVQGAWSLRRCCRGTRAAPSSRRSGRRGCSSPAATRSAASAASTRPGSPPSPTSSTTPSRTLGRAAPALRRHDRPMCGYRGLLEWLQGNPWRPSPSLPSPIGCAASCVDFASEVACDA